MQTTDTTTTRLAALIHLTIILVLGFAIVLGLIGVLTDASVIFVGAGITLLFGGALYIAQRHLAHKKQTLAAYWVAGGALIAAALLTAVVPNLYTSNAVVPLLVATVLLQYAPYQHSRYYLGICGMMSVGIVAVGLTSPSLLVEGSVLIWLNISLLMTNVGVALFMLWQFRMRLQETVVQVQEINSVLIALNNRLQRELHEHQRTEAALDTSERRMRALLNAIPDMLFRLSCDGRVLDVKPIESLAIAVGTVSIPLPDIHSLLPPPEWIERAISTRQLQRYESQLVIKNEVYEYEGRLMVSDDNEVVAIVRDVTDLKRVERLKAEFVSTVSHELRTPLTALRGALGLMSGGATGEVPGRARPMLDIAQRNCERLLRLVNDILDLDRLEVGKLPMQLQPCQLPPLIAQAVTMQRALAEAAQVTITLVQPLPEVAISTDGDRFLQVMTNLLSNAVKFSPAGSTVRVASTHTASTVRVTVADQGPGIPEAFRSRIFQRFAQADGTDQRRMQGSGLGLSIAKAIAEQCGGRIGFVTEVGQGTTFYLEFPVVASP